MTKEGLIQRLRKAGYDEEMHLFIEIRKTIAEMKKPFNQIRSKDSWNMGYFTAKREDLKALDSGKTGKTSNNSTKFHSKEGKKYHMGVDYANGEDYSIINGKRVKRGKK